MTAGAPSTEGLGENVPPSNPQIRGTDKGASASGDIGLTPGVVLEPVEVGGPDESDVGASESHSEGSGAHVQIEGVLASSITLIQAPLQALIEASIEALIQAPRVRKGSSAVSQLRTAGLLRGCLLTFFE